MNDPNAFSSLKEPHLETMRVHFDHLLVAVDLLPSSANTIKIATDPAPLWGLFMCSTQPSCFLLKPQRMRRKF